MMKAKLRREVRMIANNRIEREKWLQSYLHLLRYCNVTEHRHRNETAHFHCFFAVWE